LLHRTQTQDNQTKTLSKNLSEQVVVNFNYGEFE